MNQPLVTFGLPAFKGAHFAEALRSIRNQTYRNIEVIVQDDASKDGLKAIFDAEVGGDPRFSYARSETNSAPNFVRNWQLTVEKAKGEFFVLAGDDDIYDPDFVSDILALAGKHPTVDLFFAQHTAFNQDGIVNVPSRVPEFQSHVEWMYSALCDRREYQAQCGMMRLSALRRIGGFADLPVAWPSDLVTWTALSRNGVATTQRVLMHWRYDGKNISSLKDEYWSLLKIDAALGAQDAWLSCIRAANPSGAVEHWQLQAVIRRMTDGYVDWFVFQEFSRLRLITKLRVLRRLVREGRISCRRAIGLAVNFVKQWVRGMGIKKG